MTANRSVPPGPIIPLLVYDDVGRAIDWLCRAFGFTERLHTPPEPDGTIHHAQLAIGAGAVILRGRSAAGSNATDSAEFRPPHPNEVSQSVVVPVEDVDRHCAQASAFGARIVSPPNDHIFGERQYIAEDIEGHRWTFTHSIADIAPESWGALQPAGHA